MTLSPPAHELRKADLDQLKVLAVLHFVFAGLTLLGLGLLFLHWFMMHTFLDNPKMWNDHPSGPPPKQLFTVFRWFYVVFGSCIVLAAVANTVSGWLIRRRRGRMVSLVVAGLDCMAMPFGTALGVFTWIVLMRESVADLYESAASPAAPVAPTD